MSKKKDDKSGELSEQEKLNRRVDAMLSPDKTQPVKTAPEVPGKLLDKVDKEVKTAPQSVEPAKPAVSISAVQAPEVSPPEAPKDPVDKKDPLDDEATDQAVSDIAAKEGNTLLALQDAIGHKASRVAGSLAEQDRRKTLHRHWAWFLFIVVFIILVLLALPLDSYACHWPVGIRLRVTTDILPSVCK